MRYARAIAATAILGALGAGFVGITGAQAEGTVPACGNADLKASFVQKDAGAGHAYGKLRLRNVSGHACTTGGFGGLSYVGHGDGTRIGAPADRDHTRPARKITLQPGQRVISWVELVSAAPFPKRECKPTAVDGFRVYVPNATKSQFVAYKTVGCANPAVHLLSHRAYRRP
jgi:hypothetical protein